MFTWWQVGGTGAERKLRSNAGRTPRLNVARELRVTMERELPASAGACERASDGVAATPLLNRRVHSRRRQRGSAMVEMALMAPWIFFLFVGVLDTGFYAYSLICVQNAAREAALRTSVYGVLTSEACVAALDEVKWLPNARSIACPSATLTAAVRILCTQGTVSPSTIVCDAPGCADCGTDPKAASTEVTVTYQTPTMIPIPGVLANQLTMVRKSEVRIVTP